MKINLSANGMKWRGKHDGLPTDFTYELGESDPLMAEFTKGGYLSIDPRLARERLNAEIKSAFGKKPSNKYWMYISLSPTRGRRRQTNQTRNGD